MKKTTETKDSNLNLLKQIPLQKQIPITVFYVNFTQLLYILSVFLTHFYCAPLMK